MGLNIKPSFCPSQITPMLWVKNFISKEILILLFPHFLPFFLGSPGLGVENEGIIGQSCLTQYYRSHRITLSGEAEGQLLDLYGGHYLVI